MDDVDKFGGQVDYDIESDSGESWKGIDEVVAQVEEENKVNEENSDSDFEEEYIDASENEELFDQGGNKMSVEDLAPGMRKIFNRHMQPLENTIKKYEAIEEENQEV